MAKLRPEHDEQWVADLWQWVVRARQYSTAHVSCLAVGARAHSHLVEVLAVAGSIDLGALRDSLVIDGRHARQNAIRERFGPYLHERGVLLVRFVRGVDIDELTEFVNAATLAPADAFAKGGLRAILSGCKVSRIEVEEISHKVINREEDRQNKRLRDVFVEMLRSAAGKEALGSGDEAPAADSMLDLLGSPELFARMLEVSEPPEAIAGIVTQLVSTISAGDPSRSEGWTSQLRAVLLALRPEARDRLLGGIAAMPPDQHAGLMQVFAQSSAAACARIFLPLFRLRVERLDEAFAILAAMIPAASRRRSAVAEIARLLPCLPLDEDATLTLLGALAIPPNDEDPAFAERTALSVAATRLAANFSALRSKIPPISGDAEDFSSVALTGLDARLASDVMAMSSRKATFQAHCKRLPALAVTLAEAGRDDAIVALHLALVRVDDWRQIDAAASAIEAIAATPAARVLLRAIATAPEAQAAAIVRTLPATMKDQAHLLVAALEHMDDRKLRRHILDALTAAGPALLPTLTGALQGAPPWFVVRNVLGLIANAAGRASDIAHLVTHAHTKVRMELTRTLGSLKDDEGAPEVLVTLMCDEVQEVRAAAAQALRTLPLSAGAVAALEAIALSEDRPRTVREQALSALSRARDDAAAHALFGLLEPRSMLEGPALTAIREKAAGCLLRSRARAARELFDKAQAEGTWRVRRACSRSMEESLG